MNAPLKHVVSKYAYAIPLAASSVACYSFYFQARKKTVCEEGVENDTFFGYCPKSQVRLPKRPYPAWDDNWDGKNHEKVENGVTKHIILVR